jgi:hypothetical protein
MELVMNEDTDTPGGNSAPPAPAAAKGSRPPRAKRHLRLVPDTPEGTDTTGREEPPAPERNARAKRSSPDPITKLTEKQTAFCEGVAKGLCLSDAYRAAYDTKNMQPKQVWEEASKLASHPKVAPMLIQISEEKAQHLRMLASSDAASAIEVFRKLMTSADTDASKIRAAELLAKAAGVFTEKVEVTDKTDRSASEIEQAIKDRLARLGLTG